MCHIKLQSIFNRIFIITGLLLLLAPQPAVVGAGNEGNGNPAAGNDHTAPAPAMPARVFQPAMPADDPFPTLYTDISASPAHHSCAVTSNGALKCWGRNDYGQLGDGTNADRNSPVLVAGLAISVTAVTTGAFHTCALTIENGIKCWGWNEYGQLGDGTNTDRLTPVDVAGLTSGVIAVSAGEWHTCALVNGGGVKCWGGNWSGQLGDGNIANRNTSGDVTGLTSGVTALAVGFMHSCVITSTGGAKCWGPNGYGEVGDGTREPRYTPVDVLGLDSGLVAISAGGLHSCVILSGGGAKCWGSNEYGQLGDGTTTDRLSAVDVIGLNTSLTAIKAGGYHTCALAASGAALCWGRNENGQLGLGTQEDQATPVVVAGLYTGVMAISAGEFHTCALVWGLARCWGSNSLGQLGNRATTSRSIPAEVVSLKSPPASISTGENHTCALASDHQVRCWGANAYGQLGDGTHDQRSTPIDVTGLPITVTAISAGRYFTCALDSAGGAYCWGSNEYGQLGDGTMEDHSKPGNVTGLDSGAIAISTGVYNTCALMAGGGVKCWGSNYYGNLGDGTTNPSTTPVDVIDLGAPAVAISVGGVHTCALLSGGTDRSLGGGVKCWGLNMEGELGDGTNTQSSTPVDVIGLTSGVDAISAGSGHTCALLAGGGVKCWGANFYGQVGNGAHENINTPADVVGLASGVSSIQAGSDHTCAVTRAGAAKCWGSNYIGALGDGTLDDRNTPTDVTGLASGASAIIPGWYHTCALLENGNPRCWGMDWYGQLGLGTVSQSLYPLEVIDTYNPSMTINHYSGKPGSIYTITGWGFPSGAQATLTINNQSIATLTVNPTGGFIFFLDTNEAEEGGYGVKVTTEPEGYLPAQDGFSASAAFLLAANAPLRLQEGGGQVYPVALNIALHNFLYWPLVTK